MKHLLAISAAAAALAAVSPFAIAYDNPNGQPFPESRLESDVHVP